MRGSIEAVVCVIEHYGLLNIVYEIKLLELGSPRYERALKALDSSDSKPRVSVKTK
ncbi:hypothetical protein R69888_06016 [Paraburkholderia haematera]|uniref:Uncharacterized protein n=1 Tax=Paraburkholderia haematera TaxID=2793077 RepID=A0ABN7MNM5_9BURK|nr:hypothetical protein R69888_06016 [Paraburkholderia haematera]